MDAIEKLSTLSLVACDQAYNAGVVINSSKLAPFADSPIGTPDVYPNMMPGSFYDPVYVGLNDWTVFDRIDDPVTGFGATIYKRVADGKTEALKGSASHSFLNSHATSSTH